MNSALHRHWIATAPSGAAPHGFQCSVQPPAARSEQSSGMLVAIMLAILCALATAILPSPAAAALLPTQSVIYGVATDNNIYSIDPATGAVTGTTSTASLALSGSDANAFALNRDRAQIYFLSSSKDLYYWDIDSGTGAQLATASQLGIDALNIPRNATLINDGLNDYFAFIPATTHALYYGTISYAGDLPTGITMQTPVSIVDGSPNLNPNDIAYDPDDGMIYGSNFGGAIFSLDAFSLPNTLSYTELYTTGTGLQLAFDKDYATLYGQNFQTGEWFTVSTAPGGSLTPTGGTSAEGFRMNDLAGGVQAVPEPSGLALAGFGVAAGGAMIWRRRHRRRRGAPRADARCGLPGPDASLDG